MHSSMSFGSSRCQVANAVARYCVVPPWREGLLPDVYRDTAAAADAMREHIPGVAVALMLASTLHAIAVGNCLPAGQGREAFR